MLAVLIATIWLSPCTVFSASNGEELFDTKSADDHFNKGLKLYFQKDYIAAIQQLTRAIYINPQNPKAHYFIGYAYYEQGNTAKANRAFKKAYDLEIDYSPSSLFQ